MPINANNPVKIVKPRILDCPGYQDSKGCFMVIANGYFHYRIFSKVKNMKFLITFNYDEFNQTMKRPV